MDPINPVGVCRCRINQYLQRALGPWMLTALVAGNMIGSGIFLLPATLQIMAHELAIMGFYFSWCIINCLSFCQIEYDYASN